MKHSVMSLLKVLLVEHLLSAQIVDLVLTGELRKYLVPCGNAQLLAAKIDKALSTYPEITEAMLYPFSQQVAWRKFKQLIEQVRGRY